MPYNSVADIFHTKHFVADFYQAKCDFRWNTAVLPFWVPLWGLRGNVRRSS